MPQYDSAAQIDTPSSSLHTRTWRRSGSVEIGPQQPLAGHDVRHRNHDPDAARLDGGEDRRSFERVVHEDATWSPAWPGGAVAHLTGARSRRDDSRERRVRHGHRPPNHARACSAPVKAAPLSPGGNTRRNDLPTPEVAMPARWRIHPILEFNRLRGHRGRNLSPKISPIREAKGAEMVKHPLAPQAWYVFARRTRVRAPRRTCQYVEHPGRVQRGENSHIRVRSRESVKIFGLGLPCHEIFVWTVAFPRGMLVPCHSPRSAAHCGTRRLVARIASILSQERFRQPVRPGPAGLRGVLVRRRARPPSACRLHEGARRLGREGCGHRPSAAEGSAVERRPRLLNTDVPEPEGVPAHPARIRGLGIAAVADAAHRALWNTLIAREHPHGMTTFAGCQVRYLVGSAHGWLGAAGFAAAALRAAARDRWIGWDDAGRRGHLQRVVCLSRFLIRPSVRCRTWPATCSGASCAACRATSRNATAFARISLRASPTRDMTEPACARPTSCASAGPPGAVARTGRKRRAQTVKTVFVYELERSWRTKLGVARVEHAPSLEPGEGLNAQDWAHNEFGGAPLGDRRLSARLVKSAGLLAAYPGQKINAAPDADNTAVNAFYRLIEAPAESEITPGNISRRTVSAASSACAASARSWRSRTART